MTTEENLPTAIEEEMNRLRSCIEETKHTIKQSMSDRQLLADLVAELRALNVRLTELQATQEKLEDGEHHA